jgi:hypothetical protein
MSMEIMYLKVFKCMITSTEHQSSCETEAPMVGTMKVLSFGMLHHAAWCIFAIASEEYIASIFRVEE